MLPSINAAADKIGSPTADISGISAESRSVSMHSALFGAENFVLPIDIFIHLAHGFDSRAWRRRWESGELVGLNEPTPYGYGRASERVRNLRYSKDCPEGPLRRLARLGVRAILGFDALHALSNRHAIAASDVIWTHTESQFLAVALLSKIKKGPRPALIGQSVWLFDQWRTMSAFRRRFYAWLIREVDVLTVHSPENLAVAQRAFPDHTSELVRFGICTDRMRPPAIRTRGTGPFRVLAVGNDRHRDWKTAVGAVRGLDEVHLTIVSSTAPASLLADADNVELTPVQSNGELDALYESCDAILVPLEHNLHASGITVLQEAAVQGIPALASDTGGLRAYFGDDDVAYVPVGDPSSLRAEILALKNDEGRRLALARRAQGRMGDDGLSSQAFVERHLEISRTLVGNDRKVPRK